MLIRGDYTEIKSSQHLLTLPWKWCHGDPETSAFYVNIRLFMFQEIIFDQ